MLPLPVENNLHYFLQLSNPHIPFHGEKILDLLGNASGPLFEEDTYNGLSISLI